MRTKLIVIVTVIFSLLVFSYAAEGKKWKSANQLFPREVIRQTMNYRPEAADGSWDCLPFTMEDVNIQYPQSFDWRELGGVTPIDIQPDNGCGGLLQAAFQSDW